jgi:metallo-beta-lactamase family protein
LTTAAAERMMRGMAKLTFLGAAGCVTGSSTLLESDDARVLVDCGLFQEWHLKKHNWREFPFDPSDLDAVLLTHAHLDHCGLLPRLVAKGFRGPIYCTAATAAIARIILLDSAHIQEEDAAFKRRRHEREGRSVAHPPEPLYTTEQAEAVSGLFRSVGLDESVGLDGCKVVFREAGHVFGSTSIRVDLGRKSLVFSGDVGRWDRPILHDPAGFDRADLVVLESTYGGRTHEDLGETGDLLARIINETHDAGGNVVIPSFALERAQDVLYELNELLVADRIPHLMVFLDSPMASRITAVFREHPELFDADMRRYVSRGQSPFDFPGLQYVAGTAASKAINHLRGTAVIIAGSGMCTGGRIKHHLVHNIERPESTLLFVGYQASGTLGRRILEGEEEVRILGQKRPVRARIERINGFSGHADQGELIRWIEQMEGRPSRVFLNHGEERAACEVAKELQSRFGMETTIPGLGATYTI